MNFSNFKYVSVVIIASVILCCIRENGAVVQKNDESLEDTILLPRSKHTRHIRRVNKFSPSVTPPIMDLDLSMETQKPVNESDSSEEVEFSLEADSNKASSKPVLITEQTDKVDNHSSSSSELDKMNKSISDLHKVLIDESDFPTQSKPPRAVASVKETVEINEKTDRVKLDQKDQGSSKLWIYSNAVCILLVVCVSVFLIYYPNKKDARITGKDSSQSSSESSTSSSSASSMA